MMMSVQDAVQDGIPHVQIGMRHVDFAPQGPRAIGKLAGSHPLEQIQVFLHAAVAIGTVAARLGQRPAIVAGSVGRQIADVGFAVPDQLDRPLVQLLKVVGGVDTDDRPSQNRASGRPP